MKQPRALELDFVRGIAILLALGWHFNGITGVAALDFILAPGRLIGWAGVDLFFVLSGFLVGGLIFREFTQTGGFNGRRFLIRRAFKIWPVLYLYLLLLIATGHRSWDSFLIQCLLHVQNYFRTPLSQLWSLAVEEHFYLGFAALATFAFAASARRSPRVIFGFVAIALIVGCFLARLYAASMQLDPVSIQTLTHFRIDSLTAGVFLAYLHCFHETKFQKLTEPKALLFGLALAIAVFDAFVPKHSFLGETVGFTLTYIGSAAFLLFCYGFAPLGRFTLSRTIALIGVFSYPIYVFQFVPYRALEAAFTKLGITPNPAVFTLLKYASAIALGALIAKLIERPSLALRDAIFPASGSSPTPIKNHPAEALIATSATENNG